MNNIIKAILCIETILLIAVSAVLIVTSTNNSRNNKEQQYVLLEKFQDSLTTINDFKLVGKWDSHIMAAEPLYSIDERYPYDALTLDGIIMATSKYIRGEYTNDLGSRITVCLLQDKTFENGGFIYINNKAKNDPEQLFYYKYKNCFIILECTTDLDLISVNNFLGTMTAIIGDIYEEIPIQIVEYSGVPSV